jgi:hypothetical protein
MEEKIKQANPTLHRYLFTVTTFSKLLALSLFIILPFLGFYLGMQYQQKVTVVTPIALEVQKIPTPTPTLIDTTNWKIYTNTVAGYSLKYPSGWQLLTNANNYPTNIILESPDYLENSPWTGARIELSAYGTTTSTNVKDVLNAEVESGSLSAYKNYKELQINGVKAIQYDITFLDNNGLLFTSTDVSFIENKRMYTFSLSYYPSIEPKNKYLATFQNIISTFRLTP